MNRRFDWSPHQMLGQNTVSRYEAIQAVIGLEQWTLARGIHVAAVYNEDRQLIETRGPAWFIALLWRAYRTVEANIIYALDLLTRVGGVAVYEAAYALGGAPAVDTLFVQALAHAIIDHGVTVRLSTTAFIEETMITEEEF